MRLAAAAILIGIASALAPEIARAHIGHVIRRAERYLKIDASEDDTRLVVSLMLGPEEGERVLEAADADRDRQVSRAEADAYLALWGEGLREELPVTVDGDRAEVRWSDGWLEPIGPVRRVGLTVEMVAHLALEEREHAIAFEDRMVRRETFDRTDIAFQEHDGAELLVCGAEDEAPTDCADRERVIVPAGAQPTRFVARVLFPGRTASRWRKVAAGAAIVLAVAVALALIRRPSRHSAPR